MKRIAVWPVVLTVLLPSYTLAQNINTVENFPDANFRIAVEEFMRVEPGGYFNAKQAAANTGTRSPPFCASDPDRCYS